MGVYAQTDFIIECKTVKAATQALKTLKGLAAKDKDYNFHFEVIKRNGQTIEGFHSSGRVQNLEWQCGQMWEAIKDIKGVLNANMPIMEEGNGLWFENAEE